MNLEQYFHSFRCQTIGYDLSHPLNGVNTPIVYADWTASGRLYRPIEQFIADHLGPYVANTHTETTLTGTAMTHVYHEAQQIIKKHVNASDNDVLILFGAGMTAVVNKFQRILGLRLNERFKPYTHCPEERPVVFITHMEHHSNQTSWLECEVDLEIVERTAEGLPSLPHLQQLLEKYPNRPKIGSFSACSNVTGIITPYHEMAELMHQHGGLCFVDFSASAPYVDINMHPANPAQKLDAIFFSPHKFLGGPGSAGVLVFDRTLYHNRVPDHPGGGTVTWTNPWGEHHYVENIEAREDGGTPGFLQAIRAALAIRLKEEMGVENIQAREHELRDIFLGELLKHPSIYLLEPQQTKRLCIFSFYSLEKHHNLIVKLLNDRFGVQTRGGCSCAGTYGHILLQVGKEQSHQITCQIDAGDLSSKPGWVRISLHPTTTNEEALFIAQAVHEVLDHYEEWKREYHFDPHSGEFTHLREDSSYPSLAEFRPVGQELELAV